MDSTNNEIKVIKEGEAESISIYEFWEMLGVAIGKSGLGEHMKEAYEKEEE